MRSSSGTAGKQPPMSGEELVEARDEQVRLLFRDPERQIDGAPPGDIDSPVEHEQVIELAEKGSAVLVEGAFRILRACDRAAGEMKLHDRAETRDLRFDIVIVGRRVEASPEL